MAAGPAQHPPRGRPAPDAMTARRHRSRSGRSSGYRGSGAGPAGPGRVAAARGRRPHSGQGRQRGTGSAGAARQRYFDPTSATVDAAITFGSAFVRLCRAPAGNLVGEEPNLGDAKLLADVYRVIQHGLSAIRRPAAAGRREASAERRHQHRHRGRAQRSDATGNVLEAPSLGAGNPFVKLCLQQKLRVGRT